MKIARITLTLAAIALAAGSSTAIAQTSDPHHRSASVSSKQADQVRNKTASRKMGHTRHAGMMDCPMMKGQSHMSSMNHMHGSMKRCPMMRGGHGHAGSGASKSKHLHDEH